MQHLLRGCLRGRILDLGLRRLLGEADLRLTREEELFVVAFPSCTSLTFRCVDQMCWIFGLVRRSTITSYDLLTPEVPTL